MVVLDLADNTWMPLLIVGLVLLVGFGLFLNMRRHIRRVDIPGEAPEPTDDASGAGSPPRRVL